MLTRLRVLAIFAGAIGCVDVPDSIRAEFAGPNANDRSNYRSEPSDAPPVAKATATATTSAATVPDASEGDAGIAEGGAP